MPWLFIFLLALLVIEASLASPTCPRNGILNHNKSKCFFIVTVPASFDHAALICNQTGLQFASITSEEDNQIVAAAAKDKLRMIPKSNLELFLGGEVINGKVVWENKDSATFVNSKGTFLSDSKYYIILNARSEWSTLDMMYNFNVEMPFLCEAKLFEQRKGPEYTNPTTSVPKPSQYDVTWKKRGNTLYYFSKNKKTWKDAEEFCVSQGGHLASIANQPENDYVNEHSEPYSWIGAKSTFKDFTYSWVDGSEMNYDAWEEINEPRNPRKMHNCAIIHEGQWFAEMCLNENYFVCKKNCA
ncbi:hypothetical protein L596_022729 [Steinernema carpocapsae]|uniref:C-type lectin domain-containing protein n=1 Tax=Steinernema carpocapsae TaxID=34508 RepID=A0A4U5MMN6_STECR|nr:hypothetical protein L596_022729 [Steinernema carpocapsae]